jgi:hypothetical protein
MNFDLTYPLRLALPTITLHHQSSPEFVIPENLLGTTGLFCTIAVAVVIFLVKQKHRKKPQFNPTPIKKSLETPAPEPLPRAEQNFSPYFKS